MLKGLKKLPSGLDQCNDCEAGKCKIPTAWRNPGKIKVEDYEIAMMLNTCPRRLAPQPFRRPMLELALYSNAQGVHDTLARLDMQLVERGKSWKIVANAENRRSKRRGRSNANRKAFRNKRSGRRPKKQHRN